MMETVLVLAHMDENGTALHKASREAVTAGMQLATRIGAALAVGVIGTDCASVSSALAGSGARVLAVEAEALEKPRYATDAAACEALCRAVSPAFVLAAGSSRFARMMAGVAYRLGGAIDTHVTALGGESGVAVTRWFYRQRIEAVFSRQQRPWFLLLDPGTHSPFESQPGEVRIERLPAELPSSRTRVTGTRNIQTGAETIRPDASLLFVAGAGWTKKQPDGALHAREAGDLILGFLQISGASLGSSKSLVDQGTDGQPILPFLSHMNQIGQTGSTPRHPKGLSTCCHGEEPHVVGWRFIADRRAISLDPNCGWTRGKADVVYVADAFKVMEKVNRILEPSNA